MPLVAGDDGRGIFGGKRARQERPCAMADLYELDERELLDLGMMGGHTATPLIAYSADQSRGC